LAKDCGPNRSMKVSFKLNLLNSWKDTNLKKLLLLKFAVEKKKTAGELEAKFRLSAEF
jgi:hypothetical protein